MADEAPYGGCPGLYLPHLLYRAVGGLIFCPNDIDALRGDS